MTPPNSAGDLPASSSESLKSRWILGAILVVFLVIRVPLMYRQVGGQDEDCYAVPGLTILKTGLPQLPHVPARNPESVYYKSEIALFAEPPLAFYLQAAFYAVLPHQYGTARLSTAFAGLIFLWLIYVLAVEVTGSRAAALWGTGLLSLSKWFYFPATAARPDMLCAMFGIAAILCVHYGLRRERMSWFVAAGVCLGLGGLSHPFAIIYAVQLAVWVMFASQGTQRVIRPVILAGVSVIVACAWVPLIACYPDIFQMQMRNQLHNDEGGSLWYRLAMPWMSLRYHAGMMWEHCTGWQFCLALGGLAMGTLVVMKRVWNARPLSSIPQIPSVALNAAGEEESSGFMVVCLLSWSAMYLMSAMIGSHHPVIGYWVYPAGLMFICVGWCVQQIIERINAAGSRKIASYILGCLMVLSMIPGLGMRTFITHLQHWNDINYNGPRFAQRLIQELPPDAVVAVDTPFALDFLVAGRKTLLAQTFPLYFRLGEFDYDYLIVCRPGKDTKIAEELQCQFQRQTGVADDIFACYAEIWTLPRDHTKPAAE